MTTNSATQTPEQARPRPAQRPDAAESSRSGDLAVYLAAALSLGAALIHLWVAPEHFAEWWGHGAFFLVAAFAQGLFGVALLRWPGRAPVLLAGVSGNLAIVVLYVTAHTYGLPLGPHAGSVVEPEALGMAATAAELGTIFSLSMLLGDVHRRWTMNLLLLAGAALWALRFFGLLP